MKKVKHYSGILLMFALAYMTLVGCSTSFSVLEQKTLQTGFFLNIIKPTHIGNYLYLLQSNDFVVFDITNPLVPVGIARYNAGHFRDLIIDSHNHAYLTTYKGELVVLDISNPESPTEIKRYSNLIKHPASIFLLQEPYLLVDLSTHDYSGITILDITDPENISKVSSIETPPASRKSSIKPDTDEPREFNIIGGYLYASSGSNIWIYDISDWKEPKFLKLIKGRGMGEAIVINELVYSIDWDIFQIWDVSDPLEPIVIHEFLLKNSSYGLEMDIKDDYVYLMGAEWLTILDISDLYNIKQVERLRYGQIGAVAVIDDFIYVYDLFEGTYIYQPK